MIERTIAPEEATRRAWDMIVVGAGPAGAVTALMASRRGASVLLVDRARFPRSKVCGCCLNAASLGVLDDIGLGDLPVRLGACTIDRMVLAARGRRAVVFPGRLVAVSREALDGALVREAIQAGAHFLPGSTARLGSVGAAARTVDLRDDDARVTVEARVVIAADGLAGRMLEAERRFDASASRRSRMGLGAILDDSTRRCTEGELVMACGAGGYVGMVRLEDGRLDIAAAVDSAWIRDAGSPGRAIDGILREAGEAPLKAPPAASWRGTPRLSRARNRVAGRRLFVVGDAAVFVEPITGEGIAWALESGCAVVSSAIAAARAPEACAAAERDWARIHGRLLRRRRRVCRLAAGLLRHPRLTGLAAGAISHVPALATRCARWINDPRIPAVGADPRLAGER